MKICDVKKESKKVKKVSMGILKMVVIAVIMAGMVIVGSPTHQVMADDLPAGFPGQILSVAHKTDVLTDFTTTSNTLVKSNAVTQFTKAYNDTWLTVEMDLDFIEQTSPGLVKVALAIDGVIKRTAIEHTSLSGWIATSFTTTRVKDVAAGAHEFSIYVSVNNGNSCQFLTSIAILDVYEFIPPSIQSYTPPENNNSGIMVKQTTITNPATDFTTNSPNWITTNFTVAFVKELGDTWLDIELDIDFILESAPGVAFIGVSIDGVNQRLMVERITQANTLSTSFTHIILGAFPVGTHELSLRVAVNYGNTGTFYTTTGYLDVIEFMPPVVQ
jgi:hypothetical protein